MYATLVRSLPKPCQAPTKATPRTLTKVPRNLRLRLVLQPLEERVLTRPLNADLLKKLELNLVVVLNKVVNILRRPRLLAAKLQRDMTR